MACAISVRIEAVNESALQVVAFCPTLRRHDLVNRGLFDCDEPAPCVHSLFEELAV